jgi:hypothetical protein
VVAFLHVVDVASLGDHHAGRFVAEEQRTHERRVVHLVQLRVTDTAGELLDDDLVLIWIRQVNLIHREGTVVLQLDRCPCLHLVPPAAARS